MAKTLGNQIKFYRTKKGLRQQDLAYEVGISKQSISLYERGLREPSFEILNKIANFLNVDTKHLLIANESDINTKYTLEILDEDQKQILFIKTNDPKDIISFLKKGKRYGFNR